MDIIVKSKNCDVPSRLKDEAVQRIEHAARFFDRLHTVEMVFSEEHNPRIPAPAVVELTGHTKGHHIRAEGSGEDHRTAVDAAVSRFERQLARYKARLVDRTRRRARGGPPAHTTNGLVETEAPPMPEERAGSEIVRRKKFVLTPMLPEDAALQLELLGHEFYVFTNAGTGDCNVIYRRRDGHLGLIEAVREDTV